jgi:hypothetical protein
VIDTKVERNSSSSIIGDSLVFANNLEDGKDTIKGRTTRRKYGVSVTDDNRLSRCYPEIAEQWHPTKNGDLTADDVSYGMNKKVWWLCRECGHEWEAAIRSRTRIGTKCRGCRRLSIRYPEIAEQWHLTKNGDLTADDVSFAFKESVWWLCRECGHEWKTVVYTRTRQGTKCEGCNRLSRCYPEIAEQWHPTKNGGLTADDVSYGSKKKVWWLCRICGYEWEARVSERTRKTKNSGCHGCSGRVLTDLNRLSCCYPEIAEQWHPTKNGDLTADDVSYGSHKRVWWKASEKAASDRTAQTRHSG